MATFMRLTPVTLPPGRFMLATRPSVSFRKRRTMARMIRHILLTLVVLAVTGFMLLVLIGVWDRYEKEAAALGFSGPYERYLASRAGFPNDPKAYRAAAEAERARQRVVGPELTAIEDTQEFCPGALLDQLGPYLSPAVSKNAGCLLQLLGWSTANRDAACDLAGSRRLRSASPVTAPSGTAQVSMTAYDLGKLDAAPASKVSSRQG
jgi:hypothetical protein